MDERLRYICGTEIMSVFKQSGCWPYVNFMFRLQILVLCRADHHDWERSAFAIDAHHHP